MKTSLPRGVLTVAALLSATAAAQSTGAPSAPPRPMDVVVILCDQLNARVLSCYGGPVETPNIDRLAREGVQFLGAMCTCPFCSPARASIATGKYPHAHGITYNVMRRDYPMVPAPPTQEGIKTSDITTGRLLHDAGYATHFYGKWHLLDEDLPYYADLFAEHDAYAREMEADFAAVRRQPPAAWMNWYQWALLVEQSPAFRELARAADERWKAHAYREFVTKMGRLKLPPGKCFDVRVADKTVECIRGARPGPLMVTCSFNAPHDPNVVASPYYEMFDPAAIKLPANRHTRDPRCEKSWSRQIVQVLGEPGLREFLRIYYASVKLIDEQVGRVLHILEETGRLDGALVIFTADHGDMAGGHGMVWKSNDSFYDEIVRVPMLLRCPRLFHPQRCDMAVDLTDLMPTILSAAGRPIPPEAQGQNLLPFLAGRCDPAGARPYSFCERVAPNRENTRTVLPGARCSFAVRGQGWKYVRYHDGHELLFDLAADPGEVADLANDPARSAQKQRMIAALENWWRQTKLQHGSRSHASPMRFNSAR